MNDTIWRGLKILLTGNTGFKGSWLSVWLTELGADVVGYALEPPTNPSLFKQADLGRRIEQITADIRDDESLERALDEHRPELVIHMAAQPLVGYSYSNPVETYDVNVMGTVRLLEACRKLDSIRAILNITTDKCYENREWVWGYRENEALGGFDPYSNSKACSELVTSAYRQSFLDNGDHGSLRIPLASARSGNVIGGGDFTPGRLVPDIVKAISSGETLEVRSPGATRPWQHVLEPLAGYMMLSERLLGDEGNRYAEAWNFGPDDLESRPVGDVIDALYQHWGQVGNLRRCGNPMHEAMNLKLDSSKSHHRLGWRTRWDFETTMAKIVEWNTDGAPAFDKCRKQISEYMLSHV